MVLLLVVVIFLMHSQLYQEGEPSRLEYHLGFDTGQMETKEQQECLQVFLSRPENNKYFVCIKVCNFITKSTWRSGFVGSFGSSMSVLLPTTRRGR